MSIYFHREDRDVPGINKGAIREAVKHFCLEEGKKAGEINFIFCSDEYLLGMNEKFLKHDYYTDIITFNYNEDDLVSGDIFMSCDRIEENAKNFNVDPEKEFVRVCGHGLLHLLGYNDGSPEEKAKMRELEDNFIKKVD